MLTKVDKKIFSLFAVFFVLKFLEFLFIWDFLFENTLYISATLLAGIVLAMIQIMALKNSERKLMVLHLWVFGMSLVILSVCGMINPPIGSIEMPVKVLIGFLPWMIISYLTYGFFEKEINDEEVEK